MGRGGEQGEGRVLGGGGGSLRRRFSVELEGIMKRF